MAISSGDPWGFLTARGERMYRSDGSGKYRMHVYRVTDRNDFNEYMQISDDLDMCRTLCAKRTMADLNVLLGHRKGAYEHNALHNLLVRFIDHKREVTLSRGVAKDYAMEGESLKSVGMEMETIFSLHKLQAAERFTSPVSVLITPDGHRVVEPGATRRIFGDTRPDLVDAVLSDYRSDTTASFFDLGEYDDVAFYEMDRYDNIDIRSNVFHDGFPRFQYTNETRYFKYLEEFSISPDFRLNNVWDSFRLRQEGLVVYVNDQPLAENVGQAWRMIPYRDPT